MRGKIGLVHLRSGQVPCLAGRCGMYELVVLAVGAGLCRAEACNKQNQKCRVSRVMFCSAQVFTLQLTVPVCS